jgi:hypothetical protein
MLAVGEGVPHFGAAPSGWQKSGCQIWEKRRAEAEQRGRGIAL